MAMPSFPHRLDSPESDHFIDAAAVAFAEARTIPSVARCSLTLHATAGPPVLAISDGPALALDRVFAAMRVQARPIATIIAEEHVLALPVVGPAGWFATLACAGREPLAVDAERELAMIATRLSVWCAARGIAAVPHAIRLPARQYQIAQLICNGMTNPEIATTLGISINTVKMRLKQMFERLAIDSRDAVAELVRRFAPLEGVPLGASQRERLTIVRSAQVAAWVV
jgi:DNA-binding CsgD family transcriptional regulator